MRLRDVRGRHVQALVDRLAADGLSESRIRSVVSAVRALYGYAIEQGYVEVSPATGSLIPSDGTVFETDRADSNFGDDTTDFPWPDNVDASWENGRSARTRPRPSRYESSRSARKESQRDRSGSDYQPIAQLPERILSLVLRIVVVIFILFALVTIVGSA